MTIKKLLMSASIVLQFSSIMPAYVPNQANFNAAFLKFANTTDLISAAKAIIQNSINSSTQAFNTAKNIGSPEGWAVGGFMAKTSQNTLYGKAKGLTASDVQNAIQVALGNVPAAQQSSGSSSAQPSTQPSSSSNPQLSDVTYSAPVWARTLASFGGGQAVYDKAAQVPKNLSPNLSNENFYNNAKVLIQYFSKPAAGDFSGVLNPTDLQYLQKAFSEAGVTIASSTPSSTAPSTNGSTPADTAAANLKVQIESSKVLYNNYLQSLGKPTLYVAQ